MIRRPTRSSRTDTLFPCSMRCRSESGLPILEVNLAARRVFREVLLPVRVDGNQRWFSLSGGPLFDERNQFVGYSGIGADLTDARRSENQARQLALFDT